MIKKAIILSAGKGERMGNAVKDIPKVMLKLNGKPLLRYGIDMLKGYGTKEICINLHYLPDKITDYFGDGKRFGVKIHYNHEPELLGTSGALRAFKKYLDEDFFVIYGDVIGKVNLEKLVDFHEKNKSDATLIVHESGHPEDSDIVQIDSQNRIRKFVHKPGNRDYGTLGNAAWYIVSPKIFDFINGKSDFVKDIFPKMLESGLRIYAYNTAEFISDVGTPERFKKAQLYMKE